MALVTQQWNFLFIVWGFSFKNYKSRVTNDIVKMVSLIKSTSLKLYVFVKMWQIGSKHKTLLFHNAEVIYEVLNLKDKMYKIFAHNDKILWSVTWHTWVFKTWLTDRFWNSKKVKF